MGFGVGRDVVLSVERFVYWVWVGEMPRRGRTWYSPTGKGWRIRYRCAVLILGSIDQREFVIEWAVRR